MFLKEGSSSRSGTLAGNKKLVYVLMKILKKCTDDSITSFLMKFAVDRALDDKRYETAQVGASLRRVLRYYTVRTKFTGVHPSLADIGVKDIEVRVDGFLFKKTKNDVPEFHVNHKDGQTHGVNSDKIQKLEEAFNNMRVQMEEQEREQKRQMQKYKSLQEQNRKQEQQIKELKKVITKMKRSLKENQFYDSDAD